MRLLRHPAVFYLLLTAALLIRFFPFGFRYFPIVDDYNQYGTFYHLLRSGMKPMEIFFHYNLQTTRPLAGLTEVFLIAPLWKNLPLVLAVFILLHAAALPLADYVFKRCGLPWGRAASLAFGLYPLLGESAYWISAASRIVPGFFFVMLSAYFLCRYLSDLRRYRPLALAAAAAVLSLGFYEQAATFAFGLYVVILFNHRKSLTGKRAVLFAWPLVYAGIIGGYYAAFMGTGRLATRSELAGSYTQVWDTVRRIGRVLLIEQPYNLKYLLTLEIPRLAASGAYFIIGAGLGLAVLLAVSLTDSGTGATPVQPLYRLCAMAFLFTAAFGPFFVLRSSYVSLRNVFFGVPVMAMAVQWLWDRLACYGKAKIILGVSAALAAWVCILLNAGTAGAFRVIYECDRTVAENILEVLHDGRAPGDYRKVWLYGTQIAYRPHGAIGMASSTSTDWGLTGLVNVWAGEYYGEKYLAEDGYYLNPVPEDPLEAPDINPETDLLLVVDGDMNIHVID